MATVVPYLYAAIGLVLLGAGAGYLIKGAVALASHLRISPLVIGLTIIALGTSLPELVVCIRAAMAGVPGIAVGNVVGSNIANILLILGAGALIYPISANKTHFLRDSAILLLATAIFAAFAFSGTLTQSFGLVMVTCLIAFLLFSYQQGRKHGSADLSMVDMKEASSEASISMTSASVWVVGGLIAVAVGAELLVNGATTIARGLGVSEEVIGLTMVAVGTSLPELATVIAAAAKKHTDLIVGNIIGSNVFNIFGVMGATAVIADVPVATQILSFDIWIMAATAILLIPTMLSRSAFSRTKGFACLVLYAVYIAVQFVSIKDVI